MKHIKCWDELISYTILCPLRYMCFIIYNIYSRTPLIRTLVIRIANYTDRLGPSGRFVDSSTRTTLTCLVIPAIGSSTVQCYGFLNFKSGVVARFRRTYILWIVTAELQNCQYSRLFSKKNPVIRIFCISGWLGARIYPERLSYIVYVFSVWLFQSVGDSLPYVLSSFYFS